MEHRKFPDQKREDGIEVMGEKCRALEGYEYARGGWGVSRGMADSRTW
jgi:hypothetical protein